MADITCKQCGQTFSDQPKLDLHDQQMHLSGRSPGMAGEKEKPEVDDKP